MVNETHPGQQTHKPISFLLCITVTLVDDAFQGLQVNLSIPATSLYLIRTNKILEVLNVARVSDIEQLVPKPDFKQ